MTRLLVLWLLSERSMHGYQIKKSLTDGGMRFWFDIEDTSIYSALRTLVRQGFAVEAEVEAADTLRPRTRYAITRAGREHYADLLRRAYTATPSFTAPVDVAISAGGDLAPADVRAALITRATGLQERLDELASIVRSAPSPALVTRHRAHLNAELDWTRDLLGSLPDTNPA